jgi:hypothetical protein
MVSNLGGQKVPGPEDETRFWSLIEAAWATLGPGVRSARQALVTRPSGSPADISPIAGALGAFLAVLAGDCRGLSSNLHHQQYGHRPDTGSGISRESGQNLLGWVQS